MLAILKLYLLDDDVSGSDAVNGDVTGKCMRCIRKKAHYLPDLGSEFPVTQALHEPVLTACRCTLRLLESNLLDTPTQQRHLANKRQLRL